MQPEKKKRYNPRTYNKHLKILDKCTKTTLQKVKYVKGENGIGEVKGTEVLASHSGQVFQKVRKMGVLPVDRVGYKKGKVKSINDPGKANLINKYSLASIANWNNRKDKP